MRGGGRSPRNSKPQRNQATPKVLDRGWDDYIPPDPQELAADQSGTRATRQYKKRRSVGRSNSFGFLLMAVAAVCLVLGGLYFVVRPAVVHGIVDWAAENPTALKLPFVHDIVQAELGPEILRTGDPSSKELVPIQVASDATPHQIGEQLTSLGLIDDPKAFVYAAIEKDATEKFQIGRHVLARSMTMDQIIATLTSPETPALVRVTFREGLRLEQMIAKLEYLESNPEDPTVPLKMDVAAFYDLVKNPPASLLAKYTWLKLPQGATLEGFLYPATYQIPGDEDPMDLVSQLLDSFARHAPEGLLDLPADQIYEKVKLASLVEMEAKVDTDRPLIAGVYANRLESKNWPTRLLNADPTLSYANDSVWLRDPANPMPSWVDYVFWDSTRLVAPFSKMTFPDDLAAYNSYSHKGLPPSPICSPSEPSLEAAMTPDTSDGYLFFLAKNDGSGTHAFAKTQAEQDANAKKYGYDQ
jgi:UPF0755 protein